MKLSEKKRISVIYIIAIFGNAIYVLWILRNGINEGFSGTIVQIVSLTGLIFLLILNIILLSRKS
jgi:hypothetical protein